MKLLDNPRFKSKLLEALAIAKELAPVGKDIVLYTVNEKYKLEYKDDFIPNPSMTNITEVTCTGNAFVVNYQKNESASAQKHFLRNIESRSGGELGMIRDGTYIAA